MKQNRWFKAGFLWIGCALLTILVVAVTNVPTLYILIPIFAVLILRDFFKWR